MRSDEHQLNLFDWRNPVKLTTKYHPNTDKTEHTAWKSVNGHPLQPISRLVYQGPLDLKILEPWLEDAKAGLAPRIDDRTVATP